MERLKAYLLISIPYIIGCTGGWFIFWGCTIPAGFTYNIILWLLVANLFATVVVWLFGVIFKNSSFYDPYWSFMPWMLLLWVMLRWKLFDPAPILFFIVFTIWSWRLTLNWAYTCKSIKTEDWRYTKYRAENKVFIWRIINFFGINLMPTLVVYLALIPGIIFILDGWHIGFWNIFGAAIILMGTALETTADISMHRFRKANTDLQKVYTGGLWKYSRHPNYLGEIMVWIGVYISAINMRSAPWWFAGMIGMIVLFTCVSIPLMEKRQLARRPEYAEYRKNTRMLLPIPKFKKSG